MVKEKDAILEEENETNEEEQNFEETRRDDGGVQIDPEDIFASWKVHESENHKKTKNWFIGAGIIFAILLIYSFYTANFSFAIILIIIAIVTIIKDSQEATILDIYLTHKGVKLGRKFYDFDQLKNFAIIYKPDEKNKILVFQFKNVIHPEMIIPLEDINPVEVRNNLLKYMEEDLERIDVPMADTLNKLLKL